MNVEIIKCLQDNYSYLLIDKKSKKACVIDPGEANPIINYIEKNQINLKYILTGIALLFLAISFALIIYLFMFS